MTLNLFKADIESVWTIFYLFLMVEKVTLYYLTPVAPMLNFVFGKMHLF